MRGWRNALACSLLGIPAAIWIGNLSTASGSTELVFLSVGQGDSAVIRSRGLVALVDVGPKTERFDAGERLVGPKLSRMGISKIDIVFLTHPDSDHIGGLPAVAKSFRIGLVAMPAHFRANSDLLQTLDAAGIEEGRRKWLQDQSTVTLGDASMLVRFVPFAEDENSGSLVLKLLGPGASRAVLTGDAGEEQEITLAGQDDWSAQVLKAGHHGSATSTSPAWLAEVEPRFVVISCGRDNQFGHPAPSVLERISFLGARALRTDQDGDIHFVATQGGFEPTSGQ